MTISLAVALALTGCLGGESGTTSPPPTYGTFDAGPTPGTDTGVVDTDASNLPPTADAQVFPPFDPPSELTIATYNVENLFDLVDDPDHEEGEFTPSPGRWDASRVASRLSRLAQVFKEIDADIVEVNEVENLAILTQLRDTIRQAGGPNYLYLAVANGRDIRGIKVSVMSRYPIVKSFGRPINLEHTCLSVQNRQPITLNGSTPEPRPIFQVEINVDADQAADLILLGNHWKAKIGESFNCDSDEHRLRSGLQLRAVYEQLMNEDPQRNIVALGDFNSFEFERPLKEGVQAELNLDAQADIFDAWGDAGVIAAHTTNNNRWNNVTNSTYYYSGDWGRLDHLLLGAPLVSGANGWSLVPNSVEPVHPAFALKSGHPAAWNGNDGSGYSDHLPVRLKLRLVN